MTRTGQKMSDVSKVEIAGHYDIWRSGFVNRWHTFPDARVRNAGDTTAAHQWRVAILVTRLSDDFEDHSHALREVCGALYHDVDELVTGDLARPFKEARPDIRKATEEHGKEWLKKRGVPDFPYTSTVEWCDRMDQYLFVAAHAPDLLNNLKWAETRKVVLDEARRRDVFLEVKGLLEAVLLGGKF